MLSAPKIPKILEAHGHMTLVEGTHRGPIDQLHGTCGKSPLYAPNVGQIGLSVLDPQSGTCGQSLLVLTLSDVENLSSACRELHDVVVGSAHMTNLGLIVGQLASRIDISSIPVNQVLESSGTTTSTASYVRIPLCRVEGLFSLLLMVWMPQASSAIHDHDKSKCWMTCVSGSLSEHRYTLPTLPTRSCEQSLPLTEEDKPLLFLGIQELSSNVVIHIENEDEIVHAIHNPSASEWAFSLHLYSPPLDKLSVYNVNTGRREEQDVSRMGLFSKSP